MFGNEPIVPSWGIVTDMNEFRLYWYDRAPQNFLRFVIRPTDLFQGDGLLANTDDARFERFLFWKVFQKENLLTSGGKSRLAQLIARQWVKERELENTFYEEYRVFRERLYLTLVESNPSFPGTKGRLVRIAQKILDRCIFIFFCEDMGQALGYPPQLLRDLLIHDSRDEYFDPKGDSIWKRLIRLCKAMNNGTAFGSHKINQFNGGLFADDAELESLHIPNDVFCQPGQGQNEASLYTYKQTLLYLSASYNYAAGWAEGLTRPPVDDVISEADAVKRDPSKSLGLYTLGRIFEQSITELEILEAEADGLPSLNKETKRKRDGVYYTPEWVVEHIVKETLGKKLDELKSECGWPRNRLPQKEQIDTYGEKLKSIKIVDPACGSGAFLISALRYLLDEWHQLEAVRRQVESRLTPSDDNALIRDILRSNIYGVDINPASVEITRLALWLHTAKGDKPLSSLEGTIRDGNSLIDDSFYKGQIDLDLYDDVQKERINAFNWEEAFPEVFEEGGFDVVVGNPPYVKLQNFRNVHKDMAEFLRTGRPGVAPYRSTQTGNFDLYLPFIEKGLQLLKKDGRMGYIAPSLWSVNDYGAGLRNWIAEKRYLDGWIDFRSFQVFDEATIYTALQFYAKKAAKALRVAFAADGVLADDSWSDPASSLSYEKLAFGDRWLLLSGTERKLIDKLYKRCKRMDDPAHTSNIFVGIQTSADSIYHLKRLGRNRYLCTPKGADADPPYEVQVEDEIMKPLVSGTEAKRYVAPETDTFLLFPYQVSNETVRLIDAKTFEGSYPNAWAYLKSYEQSLREREKGKMDSDDSWWAYNYPKNLGKQEIQKLIVPRLVSSLLCSVDEHGQIYLDNVDVGGIAVSKTQDPFFICGILNAPVADFVFRRISKPFRGEYRSANKQFIAPLPIPPAKGAIQKDVAQRAKDLQSHHTLRRDIVGQLKKRLTAVQYKSRPETFLFPDLVVVKSRIEDAPKNLPALERREWAKQQYEQELQGRYDAISARLRPGVTLASGFADGELTFSVDGIQVLANIFLNEEDGAFITAQWKVLASTFPITERTDGKKLCNALRKLAATENEALVEQIIKLESQLSGLEAKIEAEEAEINALIYDLYRLTPEEIRMVERG